MLYWKGYTSQNIGAVQIGLNRLLKSHKMRREDKKGRWVLEKLGEGR